MADSSEMNRKYKILLIGQPVVRQKFLDALCLAKNPHTNKCEINMGKITLEILPLEDDGDPYQNTHGIITLFDHEDKDSFNNLPNTISDNIHIIGKMLPTIVVGMNTHERSIHEETITKEEILDYLYKLGDTCACMVPYIELTDKTSASLVFVDLIKIIECSSIDRCFGIQAIQRGKCGVHQYQKLAVNS